MPGEPIINRAAEFTGNPVGGCGERTDCGLLLYHARYDGFGNLLSQTVLAGSAPSMSLSVNRATNRVTGTGVTYDSAGNLTNNGTSAFGYDELNRLISVGSLSYGYNGDNKRVVVYGSTIPSARDGAKAVVLQNGIYSIVDVATHQITGLKITFVD